MNKYVVILAAGKGTGMNSRDPNRSKVSYPILGRPMIDYVFETVESIEPSKIITVVGFGGETTKEIVKNRSEVVWQKELLGTGHAVQQTASVLGDLDGETLVIYGDTPLIPKDTIINLFKRHEHNQNDLTVVSAVLTKPTGYGRIIREHKSNKLLEIKEETDCSIYDLDINEVNTGICVINNKLLFKYLPLLTNNNSRKLFYLSQLVELFNKDGLKVDSFIVEKQVQAFGINNRVQLAYAAKVIQKHINQAIMLSGVTIEDPDVTYISPDVKIGRDSVIMPNTSIMGNCELGEGCVIGPNSYLKDVSCGDDCILQGVHLEGVSLKNKVEVTIKNSKI